MDTAASLPRACSQACRQWASIGYAGGGQRAISHPSVALLVGGVASSTGNERNRIIGAAPPACIQNARGRGHPKAIQKPSKSHPKVIQLTSHTHPIHCTATLAGNVNARCHRTSVFRHARRETSSPDEDVCKLAGILTAAFHILSLKKGGTAWLAPECATWIQMNCKDTKRHAESSYQGDVVRRDVRQANFTANVLR